jgi:hypothetical protein
MKCSALTHWGSNSTTNLPFVYVASSGNLTSTDSDAVSDSVATMGNTFCLGFEADISGGTGADNVKCWSYYEAFPTGNTNQTADNADEACYSRNISSLANDYSTAAAAVSFATTEGGTDDFDYFNTAMSNWAGAYETLIDKRAELDIAQYYYTQLNSVYTDATADSDATYGVTGFVQKFNWVDGDTTTGASIEYTDASNDFTDASSDYTSSETTYSNRAVAIASAESDYLLAQALWEQNNALISKLTVLTEIATAASNAAYDA